LHPPEFRIGEPLWTRETAEEFGEALRRLAAEPAAAGGSGTFDGQMVTICTKVWRLRNEIIKQADDPQAKDLSYATAYLDSLWEQLSDAGLEIRDHTGEAIPKTGIYMLKVVAQQPMDGITHRRVIETLKPTIYFNEKILQVGEVIVGIPKPSN
jgi:hypothetical protein